MEPEATSSVVNIPSAWYGKWDGRYENGTKIVKKSIQQQIHHIVWSRGHFLGVNIASDNEFREEITKAYIALYTANKDTEIMKWSCSFMKLLKTRGQDKKVVPESLQ